MSIRRMNGKDLKYQGFADFDDPRRAIETGKHTTIEAFEYTMKRSARHGVSVYGWMWVEYRENESKGVLDINPVRIHEAIPRCQKPWQDAKRRALAEQPLLPPMYSEADCCAKSTHCIDEHQKTVRHFRYWCLKFPELAMRAWPWMKDLLAEEALTCQPKE